MLLGALDQTIMAPALPSVAEDLGGLDQMPAVVTSYLVAATVVMPLYGKLGDRFGRKPVMQVAIGVFVTGAVLCGWATSMAQLIVFRALQGMGGGGPLIGGFFIDHLSWRWIFAIYPPLGVLAFAILAFTLRLPKPSTRPPIDYAGALTLATAVVGIVLLGQTGNPTWIVVTIIERLRGR